MKFSVCQNLFRSLKILGFLLILTTPILAANKKVNLDLIDVDIRAVIKTISDATGKNFLIDPRVNGKITLISNTALQGESLYNVFLTALRTHGYIAVEQGNIITIVPSSEAKQSASNKDIRSAKADEQITQVVKVKHIPAVQLASVLRPLMAKEAYIQAYADANLLILSDSKKNVTRLLKVVQSMDKANTDKDEIINLQYANAEAVLLILKETLPKKSVLAPRISADKRSNSIVISGDETERTRFKHLVQKLDVHIATAAAHHVVFLEHASALDLAVILEKLLGVQTKNQDPKATNIVTSSSIIADEATNSLIISAGLEDFESLQQVLKKLDVPRQQVLIEAIIAEVSIDTSGKFGIEWGASGAEMGVGSSGKSNGGLLNSFNAIANNDLSQALLTGGFSALISKNNIGIMLNAIKNDANVNILSAPKILTLDNKEAEIIVGETVPFITGSFTQASNAGASDPFQTVQREDVGLTLRIKPQINQGGVITLEVFQEISTVKNSTTAVDLITSKRSIKSNVVIANGHMLALGGLMNNSTDDAVDAVPILSDVPGLGWLFKTQKTEAKKSTLMVFIKPTIITTNSEGSMITQTAVDQIEREQQIFDAKPLLIEPEKYRYKIPHDAIPLEKLDNFPTVNY